MFSNAFQELVIEIRYGFPYDWKLILLVLGQFMGGSSFLFASQMIIIFNNTPFQIFSQRVFLVALFPR